MLAHNVETVPRIFKRIRPAFRYDRSLDVITQARDFGLVTKSNLILGMGETREEVSQALRDLHDAGCELITITQYLRPSPRHHPVERWVKPEEFVELQGRGRGDRLRRRPVRSAGPLVLPRRTAVPSGHGRALRRHRLTRSHHRPHPTSPPSWTRPPMSTPASTPTSRRRQIMQTYTMTKQTDPRIGLILLGVFVLGAALGFGAHVAAARRRLDLAGPLHRRSP